MAKEQKDIDYDLMAEWQAFMRRHYASIFEVFFYDKEQLTEEDLMEVIRRVSEFFELPVPVVHQQCESMAKVMMSKKAEDYEMFYNWQLMQEAGINNKDAFTMVVVHETTHQLLRHTHFGIFDNELWIHELTADLMAGAYSVLHGDVATGKYKYVLQQQKATLTHPDGKLRVQAVEYGWQIASQLMMAQRYRGIKSVMENLPVFVYAHYAALHKDWEQVVYA